MSSYICEFIDVSGTGCCESYTYDSLQEAQTKAQDVPLGWHVQITSITSF